jgi:hypothetical protein
MTYFEEDDIDCLRTWDDLAFYLGEPWQQVRDPVADVVLTTFFDELLVDEPSDGTARQRRQLHRLGFRRKGDRCWSWTPPSPPRVDVPSPSSGLPAFFSAAGVNMRLTQAIDRARSDMAMRVLREVYGCSPEHLVVTVVNDDADDDWEDEDNDLFPALDCASLEARFARGRSAGR